MEKEGLVERSACKEDRRARNVTLTGAGWSKVVRSAPGHVENVRSLVLDQLTPEQIAQLSAIAAQILHRVDPEGKMFVSSMPS
nr:hypothetical protein [Arthrobacter sp. H5]